jgi:hypothetical protein
MFEKTNKSKGWMKKIGIAGFLFFLLKGMTWLFLGYLLFE